MAVAVVAVGGEPREPPEQVETVVVRVDSSTPARLVRRTGVVAVVARGQVRGLLTVARVGRALSLCGMNYPLFLCQTLRLHPTWVSLIRTI